MAAFKLISKRPPKSTKSTKNLSISTVIVVGFDFSSLAKVIYIPLKLVVIYRPLDSNEKKRIDDPKKKGFYIWKPLGFGVFWSEFLELCVIM